VRKRKRKGQLQWLCLPPQFDPIPPANFLQPENLQTPTVGVGKHSLTFSDFQRQDRRTLTVSVRTFELADVQSAAVGVMVLDLKFTNLAALGTFQGAESLVEWAKLDQVEYSTERSY
jgi:hypothetical protein